MLEMVVLVTAAVVLVLQTLVAVAVVLVLLEAAKVVQVE
jgi:hypothetical protein